MKSSAARRVIGYGSHVALPLTLLLTVAGAFFASVGDVETLHAGRGSKLGPDSDGDGLADTQEFILGTNPDERDTDQDGYHDIEEVARKSDPTSAASTPEARPLSIELYSYEEFGTLNMHAAIYVDEGDTSELDFEFGVVLDGIAVPVSKSLLLKGSKAFLYRGLNDPSDVLLVLEMPIPGSTARMRGQLHTYSTLVDRGPAQRPPDAAASSIFEINGNLMEVQSSPSALHGGSGIVFKPLTGPASPPINTTGGEVCWQDIEPVGSSGSTVIYEIRSAGCEDFDSYCDSSACSASEGGVLELPDPGSLIGG